MRKINEHEKICSATCGNFSISLKMTRNRIDVFNCSLLTRHACTCPRCSAATHRNAAPKRRVASATSATTTRGVTRPRRVAVEKQLASVAIEFPHAAWRFPNALETFLAFFSNSTRTDVRYCTMPPPLAASRARCGDKSTQQCLASDATPHRFTKTVAKQRMRRHKTRPQLV